MKTTRALWSCIGAAVLGMIVATGCLASQTGDLEDEDTSAVEAAVTEVPAPICGDHICSPGDIFHCPGDCTLSQCGNGVCGGNETALSCPLDCGLILHFCGDGVCDSGETNASCPSDCP